MTVRPVALVTGGGRGIGRGISLALAGAGYAVAVNFAGNEAAARQTQDMMGAGAEAVLVQGDVAAAADRDRLVDAVLGRWGRIDVLVNNAGIAPPSRVDVLEATEDSWDRVIGVNLKGPYFLTQRVAREMVARAKDLVNPAIVTVTSLSSYAASVNRGDYCVSKAGLTMLTRLFAVRLAEYGIRVYEVRPGIIATDMTAGVREKYDRLIGEGLLPIGRWGTAEDVGRAVAALASGAFPYSTGDVVNVDGGFHLRRL